MIDGFNSRKPASGRHVSFLMRIKQTAYNLAKAKKLRESVLIYSSSNALSFFLYV